MRESSKKTPAKGENIAAPRISPARAAGFDILLRVEQGAFADELLHSSVMDGLSRVDRALCTEIVMGVLRWRFSLDCDIAALSFTPFRKLDLEVLTALRMGVYQLRFLERIPRHAAINESVELVKRGRKASAAALVNAILRKLSREKPSESGEALTSDGLARTFSHPPWLMKRWIDAFGVKITSKIADWNQHVPPVSVRMSGGDAALRRELESKGIRLDPGKLLRAAFTVIEGDITKTAAFRDGRVAVQDEASQLVAHLVGNGTRILDCCAAPGGKTAIMAERNPQATLVAAELHPQRARLTRERVRATNVQIITADARALPLAADFDRVLADVPCSGTGTLARNPDIKWRLKPEDLPELHARQVAIVAGAASQLAPGGRLVYSSCSLEHEENEEVIEEAMGPNPGLKVRNVGQELERLRASGELVWQDVGSLLRGPYLRTLPGIHPCDGFFAAIIERAV